VYRPCTAAAAAAAADGDALKLEPYIL